MRWPDSRPAGLNELLRSLRWHGTVAHSISLCSTQADLRPERDAVLAAVRGLQLQRVSMGFFGAREGRPLETCLDEVRRSDEEQASSGLRVF